MFPERLKLLRKQRGMTQIDLAKALEVSNGTVALWETGKRRPSFDMLDRLTEVFDKRLDYILGTSDDASSPQLTDKDIDLIGEWKIQEDYEDVIRKFALLDSYGQNAVENILRAEFVRCQEQGTVKSIKGISVAVKVRDM